MDIAVLLLSMCLFFAIGMPIAYALALSALVGALWIDLPVGAVMQQFASGVGKVSMLTIPFFVLAGAIMAEGGMARRLVDFAAVVVGFTRMRGGLSQVNILATTIMSGISGSSVADTSAIGSVMIPQMAAKGYPRVFATNVTISASLQAIIVPPSHNAVIYSLATGGVVSITSLFLAGVIPGLLLGFSLMLLCLFYRLSRQASQGRAGADPAGGQDARRRRVGDRDAGHRARRHPHRRVHADRGRRGRLRLGVLRHHVHLPRLQMVRAAAAGLPHAADGGDGADAGRDRVVLRLCRRR